MSGDLRPSGEHRKRLLNPRATLESSSRAAIVLLSAVSEVVNSRGRGLSLSFPWLKGGELRGSTDPHLDVDGVGGLGLGVLR